MNIFLFVVIMNIFLFVLLQSHSDSGQSVIAIVIAIEQIESYSEIQKRSVLSLADKIVFRRFRKRRRWRGTGVDWAAGTPGKIPVGRAARVGDILAARAACTRCTLQ